MLFGFDGGVDMMREELFVLFRLNLNRQMIGRFTQRLRMKEGVRTPQRQRHMLLSTNTTLRVLYQ